MREEDVKELVSYLSSFYKEYLPINSSFEELLRSYLLSFEEMWNKVSYYSKHLSIEDAPTLKTIPFAKLDVTSGVYDKVVANSLNEQPLENILSYLDERKLYVELHFSEVGTRTPLVYSLQLKRDYYKGDELTYFKDFFLRDNRIYLLPKFILALKSPINELVATNIRINDFFLEQKWGYIFDLEVENLMPRFKYRDSLHAFLRLMSSDFTIRDIKEAIQIATRRENFDVQDIKSPTLQAHKKRLYDELYLSPAQFILTLDEEAIKEKIMLNVILSLVDEAKEVQTNYLLLFAILRNELLDLKDADPFVVNQSLDIKNKVTTGDITSPKTIIKMNDGLDLARPYKMEIYSDKPSNWFGSAEILTMDTGLLMDEDWVYDDTDPLDSVNEAVLMDRDYAVMDTGLLMDRDWLIEGGTTWFLPKNTVLADRENALMDGGLLMDAPWLFNADHAEIRVVEFPKIPRNVEFLYDGTSVACSFSENNDGTVSYQLFGSDSANGEFSLLEEINAVPDADNMIIHDASESGMRYYKLRARSSQKMSLFTLTYDTMTL